MKKIRLLVLSLLVPFLASASISIVIHTPAIKGHYTEKISVTVSVTSTYAIDTVRATVAARSLLLHATTTAGYYTGTLDLSGLPDGTSTLVVDVKDVLGNTDSASQMFTFNSLPNVTVTEPINYAAFINSKIHIKASVSDPGSANCAGKVTFGNFTLNFNNNLDTVVDVLPSSSALSGNLSVIAIDDVQQTTTVNIPIYVDKSTFLKPFFTNTGQVIDFKDTRALIMEKDANNIPHLKIVNTTTGATDLIDLGTAVTSSTFVSGMLVQGGAELNLNYTTDHVSDYIYIWKNGQLNKVSNNATGTPGGFVAQGNRLLWPGTSINQQLFITNLTTFTTSTFVNNALNNGFDLSPEGTIAYTSIVSASNYTIKKYTISTGVTQSITTAGFCYYPSIDKNNIVYTEQKGPIAAPFAIHLYNGVTDTVMGQVTDNNKKYKLNSGYITFSKVDNTNVEQVWTRSPDNVYKQQSFFSSNSAADAIADKGRVIFNNANSRYYIDSLTAFTPVQSTLGKVYVVNNDFYVAMGGSVFKFDISSPALLAKIRSFTPTSAATGTTVTIKGGNFNNATAVSFGGVAAQSYHIVSDSVMTAVVGSGASGNVVVATAAGTVFRTGFTYLPTPVITSLSYTTAKEGTIVVINGSNFVGATAVTFGGTPAATFSVTSSGSITARVGNGASGDVTVTTQNGSGSKSGFVYVAKPVITASGPTTALSTDNLTLSVPAIPGYTYQWVKGPSVQVVSENPVYAVTGSGTYKVVELFNGVTVESDPVEVNVTFVLPPDNFKLINTSASCKGSATGSVNITAQQKLNYLATVVSSSGVVNTYPFSTSVNIPGLSADTYNICITISEQPTYQQCFNAVITEPKDLSVYATAIPATKQLTVSMAGATSYNVTLNGVTTTTTQGQVTLQLKPGINTLAVSTDRSCQGIYTQTIDLGDGITLFPNPFTSEVNINLGSDVVKNATVRIYDTFNRMVYTKQYANQAGIIHIDLSKVTPGGYIVEVIADGKQNSHKIIKN